MKKSILIILLPLIFSCRKEGHNTSKFIKNQSEQTVQDSISIDDYSESSDTIKVFDTLRKLRIIDNVVITRLKKAFTKDSIETTIVRLDFHNKIGLLKSFDVQVYASNEGGEWYLTEKALIDSKAKKSDCRFFELTYGVPACGFAQSNFLFFIEDKTFQLVRSYTSMGDGPYGKGVEFEPVFVGEKVITFSTKNITIDSDESKPYDDANEALVKTFSDSIIYNFVSGKWNAKQITPKAKVYRKEFKTFNQLYPQE